jgi:hypothetical protein
MADRYIFATSSAPTANADEWTSVATGGSPQGSSATIELVFDDAIFGATTEGKQRLIAAIDGLKAKVQSLRKWPLVATS